MNSQTLKPSNSQTSPAPFLSVVIANYNYGRFLPDALDSLLSQSCQDFEIIIIDGGSTDNSVEVIKKYAGDLPPHTLKPSNSQTLKPSPISYWVSEPDKGQSNAFNKGFAKARGRFLTWLNADDVMLPGAIAKLKAAVEKHPECEWFVGGCFWLDPEMRIVNCGRGRSFSERRYRAGMVSSWGPSSFFSRRLLAAVGGVDERFHYSMDTDLWLRFACQAGGRYLPCCDYAWGLRLHPDAKMSRHNFTSDGKLQLGVRHGMDERQKKAEEQKKREAEMRRMYFTPHPLGRLSRLLTTCWYSVLAARIDLLRYRGKHYLEYFK